MEKVNITVLEELQTKILLEEDISTKEILFVLGILIEDLIERDPKLLYRVVK